MARLDADRPDVITGQIGDTAQHRQQRARLGAVIAAGGDCEPDGFAKLRARRAVLAVTGRGQFLGRRGARAVQVHEGGGELLGRVALDQRCHKVFRIFGRGRGPCGIVQQSLFIRSVYFGGRRRQRPFGLQLGPAHQACRLGAHLGWHDQRRDTFAPRAARPARAVKQRVGVGGQIGVNHKLEVGQVDAACCHIGGHADARASVAQRLQRICPLGLRQLTGQGHDREVAVGQTCGQAGNGCAGVTEHDRVLGLIKAQDVEDRVFRIARVHRQRAVFDISVLFAIRHDRNALRIALIAFCQLRDCRRHSGREHQRAARFGRFAKDEFQILAEAQIQHFVRFVQHHGADVCEVYVVALNVVTQATRCSHNDVRATVQRAALCACVHAAHTGGHHGTSLAVKPC